MGQDTSSNAVDAANQGQASVDAKQQSRTYNPVDSAPRGNTSAALNTDAAKYKKAPSPV